MCVSLTLYCNTFFAVKIVAVFKNCREHRFDMHVSHRIDAIQEKKTVTGNKNPLNIGIENV